MLDLFFFNVGHGDSIAIRFPNNKWGIIDCNKNSYSSVPNVLRFLRNNDVDSLEFVCITHPHTDHFYGVNDLIEHYRENINYLILYGMYTGHNNENNSNSDLNKAIKNFVLFNRKTYKQKIKLIKSDEKINIGEISLTCINPQSDFLDNVRKQSFAQTKADYNDLSVVFVFTYKNNKIFLPGDAGRRILEPLVRNLDLHSDIVKISHHGSRENNTNEILKGLLKGNDTISVISEGQNKYNLPSQEVIEQLKFHKSEVHITCDIGNIDIVEHEVDLGQNDITDSLLEDIGSEDLLENIITSDGCIQIIIDDFGSKSITTHPSVDAINLN
ncbi:MBL fold metallo-hydrolase [bacterium]|nr:MBL fold metallo-hydrolase [bacterium]